MAAKLPNSNKEIAFYYPGPMWRGSDWIKTLILFFDGVALLLPNYLKGKPEYEDPAIALPLKDKGLLHILEPEKIVDKKATEDLSKVMAEMIRSGALDGLDKNTRFHEISYSRLGGYGDENLAKQLFLDLKAKGLAKDSEDGVSIPMHPMVRSLGRSFSYCSHRFLDPMDRSWARNCLPQRIGRRLWKLCKNYFHSRTHLQHRTSSPST